MASQHRRNEDLDMTREEFNALKEAFQKEEFRNLFKDYVDEVTDPKNVATYEKEFTQFEKERGVDVTFIHPNPGYVIKTSVEGTKKAYINVCSNDKIGMPNAVPATEGGASGYSWSLPYIQAPARDDFDKNRQLCVVYDVVYHPTTLALGKKSAEFKNLLNDTSLTAVEDTFKVSLDRKNIKFPKMGYKGYKHPSVIRRKREDHIPDENVTKDELFEKLYVGNPQYQDAVLSNTEPRKTKPRTESKEDPFTVPKFTIKQCKAVDLQDYRYSPDSKLNMTVPTELSICVHLPLLRSTEGVELDVRDKSLKIFSNTQAKYKLHVTLPYFVQELGSSAKFDLSTKILTVTAVVDKSRHTVQREDSGVECDPTRSSSDEEHSSASNLIVKESEIDEGITDEVSPSSSLSQLDIHSDVIDKSVSELTITCNDEASSDCTNIEASKTKESIAGESKECSAVQEAKTQSSDLHLSLPSHTLELNGKNIHATLFAGSITPQSVKNLLIEESSAVLVTFSSLGSGCCIFNYGFIIKPVLKDIQVERDEKCEGVFSKVCVNITSEGLSVYAPLSIPPSAISSLLIGPTIDKLQSHPLPAASEPAGRALPLHIVQEDGDSDDDDDEASSPSHSPVGIRSILKTSQSFSESYDDSLRNQEKHVTFNDCVNKLVFRANSSILGQRKKNQRKSRNKKRSQERRASESASDLSDYSQVSNESEVSDLSTTDVSDVSESDDGSTPASDVPVPGRKGHRRHQAKNKRKQANTSKIHFDLSDC